MAEILKVSGNLGLLASQQALLSNLRAAAACTTTTQLRSHITRHFQDLTREAGDWQLSIYDLAWVLSSDFFDAATHAHHLEELLAQQNPVTGLWGNPYLPHSALTDTLAVIMLLLRLQHPIPRWSLLEAQINTLLRGCQTYPHHATVAFEWLIPTLLRWIEARQPLALAEDARLYLAVLQAQAAPKLAKIAQAHGLPSRTTTISFTAEVLTLLPEVQLTTADFAALMLANGAVGLSPAATAAVIVWHNERGIPAPAPLYDYLRTTYAAYAEQGFPSLYPARITTILWNTVPFLLSGRLADLLADVDLQTAFRTGWQQITADALGRVSWDDLNRELPDLDNTAVAFALQEVLHTAGLLSQRLIPLTAFQQFQHPDGTFFCYPYELHPSVAALLHSFMALEYAPPHLRQTSLWNTLHEQLIAVLHPHDQPLEVLGHDKWHATWTYGIQRWLSVPNPNLEPVALRNLLEQLLTRQVGGWGQQHPTLEETAHVVLGLAQVLQRTPNLPVSLRITIHQSLQTAHDYLRSTLQSTTFLDGLWISKNLYTPYSQATATILAALYELVQLGVYDFDVSAHAPR